MSPLTPFVVDHPHIRVSDLLCAGKKIELRLVARRLVCSAPLCRRRIFAERFDDGVVAERFRRTSRLECVVHHLGLALGGRPAASIANRLMVPVSHDTLFRVMRRRSCVRTDPLSIVGIDDRAFRRNIATAPLYVIWSGGGSLHCCRTGRLRPSRHGSPIIRTSE